MQKKEKGKNKNLLKDESTRKHSNRSCRKEANSQEGFESSKK
jgi:hypothetical protein